MCNENMCLIWSHVWKQQKIAGPTSALDPGHLSTYPTYLFYFSTYQLYFCFTLLLAWCCFVTSFFDICHPREPISALQGGTQDYSTSKIRLFDHSGIQSDFRLEIWCFRAHFWITLELQKHHFSDPETNFSWKCWPHRYIDFSISNQDFGVPRSSQDHQKVDLKLVRFLITS